MHINPGATLRDRQRSYVDDADFFLAADGATEVEVTNLTEAMAEVRSAARELAGA